MFKLYANGRSCCVLPPRHRLSTYDSWMPLSAGINLSYSTHVTKLKRKVVNRNIFKPEVKDRKAKERDSKISRKKKTVQKTTKKSVLKCSQCSDDLISDVEDDSEKNIGCDECIRWYHLRCTIF